MIHPLDIPATEEQLLQVLALGRRCVQEGALDRDEWRGMRATESKGERTVKALEGLLATLRGRELAQINRQLGALRRAA